MSKARVARQSKVGSKRAVKRLRRANGSETGQTAPDDGDVKESRRALPERPVPEEGLHRQDAELAVTRQAIEIERSRYQDLFEFGPDAYIVTDLSGIIREANSTASTLFRFPQSYLIGKPLANYVAPQEARNFRSRLLKLAQAQEIQTWETRLRQRGGALLDGELTAAPVRTQRGEAVALRWVLRDNSERKRAEERIRTLNAEFEQRIVERTEQLDASNRLRSDLALRLTSEGEILQAIIDNTQAQLAYLDPQFDFIHVNTAYAKGSGHSKKELIGHNHFDLFPNAENQAIFERVRDSGEGVEFLAKPFVYVDQPERGVTYWNWTCVPVKDASGRVQGLVLSLLDVTETVRAQHAEQEHARKITAILESITDSYIALDQRWRIIRINPPAERTILQRPKDELLGKVIWELYPQLIGSAFYSQCKAALAERRPVHFEAISIVNGQWHEAHAYPTGEGLSIYLRDITERRREEETNARLAAIVESSEDAIIGATPEGIISSWNSGAERIFGYSANEVKDKPLSILYPDDQPDEFPQVLERLQQGERIEHYESQRVRKDGKRIEVALSISPIKDANGRIIGIAKDARDITAQKRAREAEHFLVEASAVLASSLDYEATLQSVARLVLPFLADYCVVDIVQEDGSLRRVAAAAATPAQEQLLRQLMKRYPPDSEALGARPVVQSGQPRLVWEIPDSFARGVASDFDEVAQDVEAGRFLRELAPKSFMIVPMIVRGRTIGAISLGLAGSGRRYDDADLMVARDLASRAAYAVDNARLYHDLQTAIRARDQFLSLASHEVRTPLTVIQGYTQLLRQQAEQAQAAPESIVKLDRSTLLRGLRNVEHSAARLEALMSDLLDITRLPSHSLSLSPERMNLSELLSTVVENVRGQKQHRQHSSRLDLRIEMPSADVWGNWDRTRLEQVLTNLVDNAVKYSPAGGAIQIRLAAENGDGPSASPYAHVVVSDEGIGIPPDELSKIFQPFTRATNAVEREYPGLGIGLAVSKEIVTRHGGRIWVESNGEDQGSAFHVVLPIKP